MRKNMGTFDKILRTVAAVTIAGLLLGGGLRGTGGVVLAIMALVFLMTGVVELCPLYVLLGIRTWRGEGGEGPSRIDV